MMTEIMIAAMLLCILPGAIVYLYYFDKVKRKAQKVVLFLFAGPFIWFILATVVFAELLHKHILTKLHDWMIKE